MNDGSASDRQDPRHVSPLHQQQESIAKDVRAFDKPLVDNTRELKQAAGGIITTELSATQPCVIAVDTLLVVEQEQIKVESMTETLIRCGGDIRALIVNQPSSTFHAMASNDVDAEKIAEQMAAGKQEATVEEEVEEEEAVRFVRPPRLRFALSQEAASDGFPSAIARSLRWHPDYMQDLPGDANLSIREAFDNKHDEYYVFRHWRPSQGK